MLAALLCSAYALGEKIEARGFAVIRDDAAAARKEAERRAYADLQDRIDGFTFVADGRGGVKIFRKALADLDPDKLGAKISDVREAKSGIVIVTVQADAPQGFNSQREGAETFKATGMAKFGGNVDISDAADEARTNALEDAVARFIEKHYKNAQGPVPQRIDGQVFLEGPTGEGQSRTHYLVTATVLVKIGGTRAAASAAPVNVRIDVDHKTFASNTRSVNNSYWEYKDGKWQVRRGGRVPSPGGLDARYKSGNVRGGIQLGESSLRHQGTARQSITLLDGTTGIIDLGGITTMQSPGVVRVYDPHLRRWVYRQAEVPKSVRVGRRLIAGAKVLEGNRIRVGVSPEHARVVGKNRRSLAYTTLSTNVIVRDGESIEIGGLSTGNLWARRLGGRHDAVRNRSVSDTSIILTARILRGR